MPITTVEVYHQTEPSFRTDDGATFPEGFTLVAALSFNGSDTPPSSTTVRPNAGDDDDLHGYLLGVAFQRTNHIDEPWHVAASAQGWHVFAERPRSTSVGDVVVINAHAWRCASMGWDDLGTPERFPILSAFDSSADSWINAAKAAQGQS